MKRFHLMDMRGASMKTAVCGRKLADPWTTEMDGNHESVCKSCWLYVLKRSQDPKTFSAIEDRGAL